MWDRPSHAARSGRVTAVGEGVNSRRVRGRLAQFGVVQVRLLLVGTQGTTSWPGEYSVARVDQSYLPEQEVEGNSVAAPPALGRRY
jgi:hypothetical protein